MSKSMKRIVIKYIIPIILFMGIIILASSQGSTIEPATFNMKSCKKKIIKSGKKLYGKNCKIWDEEKGKLIKCGEEDKTNKEEMVEKWAESRCGNKKSKGDTENQTSSAEKDWFKDQYTAHWTELKKNVKSLAPLLLVKGGVAPGASGVVGIVPYGVAVNTKF